MKIHIFELRKKEWISEWSSQLSNYLSSCEKKAWKKIQAWTGFEPMTSAIPVQCSTNWAIKPTGSWSLCEFVMYPLRWWDESEYMKSHIFELRKKEWINEWSLQLYHATGIKQLRWSFRQYRATNVPEGDRLIQVYELVRHMRSTVLTNE